MAVWPSGHAISWQEWEPLPGKPINATRHGSNIDGRVRPLTRKAWLNKISRLSLAKSPFPPRRIISAKRISHRGDSTRAWCFACQDSLEVTRLTRNSQDLTFSEMWDDFWLQQKTKRFPNKMSKMRSVQNPYDIPLYWLVYRDRYIGFL